MIYFNFNSNLNNKLKSNIDINSEEFNSLINFLSMADEFSREVIFKFRDRLNNHGIYLCMYTTIALKIKEYCQLVGWDWREGIGDE